MLSLYFLLVLLCSKLENKYFCRRAGRKVSISVVTIPDKFVRSFEPEDVSTTNSPGVFEVKSGDNVL